MGFHVFDSTIPSRRHLPVRIRLLGTLYAVFSVLKFCLSTMSQPSGTSGMEDHSQNDPARRDQDDVSRRAAPSG